MCAGPPPAQGLKGKLMGWGSSKALPQPTSDLGDIAACPCQSAPRMPRFEMFEVGHLGIHKQAGRDGKGRALGNIGQTGNSEGAADRDWPRQNMRGEIGNAAQQTAAAGE